MKSTITNEIRRIKDRDQTCQEDLSGCDKDEDDLNLIVSTTAEITNSHMLPASICFASKRRDVNIFRGISARTAFSSESVTALACGL